METIDMRPQRDDEVKKPDEQSSDEEETSEDDTSASQKPDDETTPTEDDTSDKKQEVVADDVDDSDVEDKVDEELETKKKEIEGLTHTIEDIKKDIKEERQIRRDVRSEDKQEVFVEKKEDLSDIAPEDQKMIDRVVEAKLKSGGYVKKDENYKLEATYAQNMWLEKHPEYLPDNDTTDSNWNRLTRALQDYKMPANPRDYGRILSKAHRDISPESTNLPTKSRATSAAAKQKIKSTDKSSGKSGAKSYNSGERIQGKEFMKGFTDEELAEYRID